MKRILAMLLCLAVLAGMTAAVAESWTCPNCGRESDGLFCPWCGQKRPEQITCPGCGATYAADLGYSFCPNCGTALTAGATPAEEQSAEDAPSEAAGVRFGSLSAGDTVSFGRYNQDGNADNGAEAIEWIVLEADGGTAVLISKDLLDGKPFNDDRTGVTWETCGLRSWLNGDFLSAAFTAEEQAMIQEVSLTGDKVESYSTSVGNPTQDRVYLLSNAEALRYFATDEARKCWRAQTAVDSGVLTNDDNEGYGSWWLRSPGYNQDMAAIVFSSGRIINCDVNDVNGIRPVVTVALSEAAASYQTAPGEAPPVGDLAPLSYDTVAGFYEGVDPNVPGQTLLLVMTPTGHACMISGSDSASFEYQINGEAIDIGVDGIEAWMSADGQICIRLTDEEPAVFNRYEIPADEAERLAGAWDLSGLRMGVRVVNKDEMDEKGVARSMTVYRNGSIDYVNGDKVIAIGWTVDGEGLYFNWSGDVVRPTIGEDALTVPVPSDDGTAKALIFKRGADGAGSVTAAAPSLPVQPGDSTTISAGGTLTLGLKTDGTVVAVGDSDAFDVSGWTDIAAVSAGSSHSVALKNDGTVLAAGFNGDGACNVSDWRDMAAVSAGYGHTVGLKRDGTVVAVGYNSYGQCDVSGWTDIVAVSAGESHTVGLKRDGSVVATGYNDYGECDVGGWTDIVAIAAGSSWTVGVHSDGTVVATGWNTSGQCDVGGWTDIVAVTAAFSQGMNTVGLRRDGTVVATGSNGSGECNVGDWTDIVAISTSADYTVGLRRDGTVVVAGENSFGASDVADWKDIRVPQ